MRINQVIFILVFSVYSDSINAQDYTQKIDSLSKVLSNSEEGSARIELLFEMTDLARDHNPKDGVSFGQQLIHEAKKFPESKVLAKAYYKYGFAMEIAGHEIDSIKILMKECLRLSSNLAYDYGILNSNYLLGNYERDWGSTELAIEHYLVAIQIGENSNINSWRNMASKALHGLGILKDTQGKHEESKEIFLASLAIGESLDDNEIKFISNQSIGISECLGGRLRSGIDYFLKAKPFATTVTSNSDILGNISLAYSLYGKLDSAEYYTIKAVSLADELGTSQHQIAALSSLAGFYEKQKNFPKMYETLKRRTPLVKALNKKKWNRTDARDYVTYYEKTGNFKEALKYFKIFKTANDSIINEKSEKAMVEMEQKYQTEKNKLLIKDQEWEIKKQEEDRKLLLLSLILLAIFSGLTFWFMRKRNIKNKTIAQQEAEINEQKIAQLEKEKKILSMSAMIEGQEAERIRIAKDLHDGLGGLLSTVKAHFSNIQVEVEKVKKINVYNKTNELIDFASSEVRRISHNLMPGALRLDGLYAAIEQIAEDLNSAHKINVRAEIIGEDEPVDEQTQVYLFRIVQEASNNVIKYAEAKNYLIQFSSTENEYHLILEDDGKGFEATDISKLKGLGLKSIKSRVAQLNGVLDIDAKPGAGTSISIHIPKMGAEV